MKYIEKFLANISVSWKLNIIILVMILGLVALFLTGAFGLETNQATLLSSYNHILNSTTEINALSNSLSIIQSNIESLLNSNISEDDRLFHLDQISRSMDEILISLEKYETIHLSTNSSELTNLIQGQGYKNLQDQEVDALRSFKNSYTQYVISETQLLNSQGIRASEEFFANQAQTRLTNAQLSLQNLANVNNRYSEIIAQYSNLSYQNTIAVMIFALITTSLIGFLVSNSVARSISSRLVSLERSTSIIEEYSYNSQYSMAIIGKDEIGSLSKSFDKLVAQLKNSLIGLEERVIERTDSLAVATEESKKRAQQLEAIVLVSNAISSLRSINEILPRITNLISQQFGYYHVGIFLNDNNDDYAILRASNSEGGQRMMQRNHKLKIGKEGIVGRAINTHKPYIALDVGEDSVYFDNPDLPNTRSEIAFPLTIENKAIGALDVQSTQESAFNEDDIRTLTFLANQVSLTIENSRLFDAAQKSLAESEALSRQYVRQAWNRLPKEQNLAGYHYDVRGSTPIEINDLKRLKNASPSSQSVSVPIKIRGQEIGILSVQVPEDNKIDDEQREIINAVAERVALSAENARLFDETTRRAERERLVSDITVKIRSTNDPDAMINVALEELKNALGATKVQLEPHTLSSTKAEESLHSTDNKGEKK